MKKPVKNAVNNAATGIEDDETGRRQTGCVKAVRPLWRTDPLENSQTIRLLHESLSQNG